MWNILHLSDLHMSDPGHDFDRQRSAGQMSLAEAVEQSLDKLHCRPSAAVLSGDFFTAGVPETELAADMATVTRRMEALLKVIESFGIKRRQIMCVPGNHDVLWKSPELKYSRYNRLMKTVGLGHCVSSNFPLVMEVRGTGAARPLALVGFDSCVIEGERTPGLGMLGQQVVLCNKMMAKRRISDRTHTMIGVMHHHLLTINAVEDVNPDASPASPKQRLSITIDAGRVLHEFWEQRYSLILHGHQHRAAMQVFEDRLAGTGPVRIAGAGSCGTSAGGGRKHYFVHTISGSEIQVRSMISRTADTQQFEQDTGNGAICRVPECVVPRLQNVTIDGTDDACFKDGRPKQHERRHTIGPGPSTLNYWFLCVRDCTESSDIIRASFHASRKKLAKHNATIEIEGIYHLMGFWDLGVRFRLGSDPNLRNVLDAVTKKLLASNQITKAHPTIAVDPFSESLARRVDVLQEFKDFADFNSKRKIVLSRTTFSNPMSYEEHRCQRAFIFIRGGENTILGGLRQALHDAKSWPGDPTSIIESISRSENEVVLELFMRCSQTSLLHALNRAIEKTLATNNVQKHTLLCYDYDERPLAAK